MKNIKIKYIILGILFVFIICLLIFKFINDEKKRNSVSVWNSETASFQKYKSYEDYQLVNENKTKKELEEYNNATKGTIVEQVLNAETLSYESDTELFQLEDGKVRIEIPAHMSKYGEPIFLWSASLEKNINAFTTGDFNKDGLEDVAHVIGYTGGGSGYSYYLDIFINNKGKLKYLTQEYLGDRIVLKGLKYDSGIFIFDMITQGEGDEFMGYCCANVKKTLKFKLENNKLIEIENK